MRSASSSAPLRLWLAAWAFWASMAALISASRFCSWASSALQAARRSASRARPCAFRTWSIWAWTFCTSGCASLYFSLRRGSSRFSVATWLLRLTTRASVATWGTVSRLWPRARICAICLSAASSAMRRPCASTWSSLSLVIELVTAETLPSGTNRSWRLVALEQLVLRLAHALLGGGQALLQPVVGLARRLHPAGERSPRCRRRPGCSPRAPPPCGSVCVTWIMTSRLSGTGSTATCAMNSAARVADGP